MAEKKEIPKHIKEFYDRDKKVKQLLAATEDIHSQAYSKSLEAIKDKKTGLPDHEMLKDIAVQDNMIDKMMDHYRTAGAEKLSTIKGKAPDKGTFEEDIFMKKFIGITRAELTRYFRKHKSKYTQKVHEKIRDNLIEEQEKELMPLRHGHLDKKHIGDILKHVGAEKYFEIDNFRGIEEAVGLLDAYRQKGEISLADLAQEEGLEHLLKKDAKDAMKQYKTKYKTGK